MAIREVDFGVDNFQKPKVLSIKDSIAQLIMNMFLMRPGNMPSLPNVGVDIRKYLYKTENQLDLSELKKKIFDDCSQLLSFVSIGDIQTVIIQHEGQDLLLIHIPLIGLDDGDESLIMGFQQEQNGSLRIKYQFESDSLDKI